jgi:hypothetical protein
MLTVGWRQAMAEPDYLESMRYAQESLDDKELSARHP